MAEDDANWKWWNEGNRTASLRYARTNPPPKGWTYGLAGKGGGRGRTQLVRARRVKTEDDAMNPRTRAPHHMNEHFVRSLENSVAQKTRKQLKKLPSYHKGDDIKRGA